MLKAAVIGVGSMGKNHARVYYDLDNVELVAVADLDSKNGIEISKKFDCKFYRDYNEMLTKEKIDVVSIAVPTTQHTKVAIDVLSKGIHVLIEKPIADTVENANKIVKLAKSKKLTLAVGHIERFNPVVVKLKKIIDSGQLGEIISIITRRVGLFPPRVRDANVVLDLGVHDIDICNYLLSSNPKEIFARGGKALNVGREDYAEIFLKYEKTNAIIQVNWITPVKIRVINITGTKGYARANYVTQELTLFKSNYKKIPDNFGDFMVEFGEPVRENIPVDIKEPLKVEILDFLTSVRENKPPLVDGKKALDALKIAIKASNMCKR
jgi:UDP-N-acetylglucosamine 3-dehydrogenase